MNGHIPKSMYAASINWTQWIEEILAMNLKENKGTYMGGLRKKKRKVEMISVYYNMKNIKKLMRAESCVVMDWGLDL